MATPPTALADVVPNSVPGPLAMETLTAAVELVTSWPMASSTRTVTPAGLDPALMGWPAIVPVGCCPNATWSGHPTVTVTEGSGPTRVKPFPVPLEIVRLLRLGHPCVGGVRRARGDHRDLDGQGLPGLSALESLGPGLRSWMTLPARVGGSHVLPGGGMRAPKATNVNPAGMVTFAEPRPTGWWRGW